MVTWLSTLKVGPSGGNGNVLILDCGDHFTTLKLLKILRKHFSVFKQLNFMLFKFYLSGGSDGKASVYNEGDLGSIPGLGSSLEKEKQPTPELLPRKSHGRRSLVSMGSQRVGHD